MMSICAFFKSYFYPPVENNTAPPTPPNPTRILGYLQRQLIDSDDTNVEELDQQKDTEELTPYCRVIIHALNQCNNDCTTVRIELPDTTMVLTMEKDAYGVTMGLDNIKLVIPNSTFQLIVDKLNVHHAINSSDENEFELMRVDDIEVDTTQRKQLGPTKLDAMIYANVSQLPLQIEINKQDRNYVVTSPTNEKITIYAAIEGEHEANQFIINHLQSEIPVLVPYVSQNRGFLRENHVVLLAIVNQKVYLVDPKNGKALGNIENEVAHINLNWQHWNDWINCGCYVFEIFAQVLNKFSQHELNTVNPFEFLTHIQSPEYELDTIDTRIERLPELIMPFQAK